MTYSEKLKDPRWQKKRLEILQRDDWTCQNCGDVKTTLNVHHISYYGNPWDQKDDLLITLCKECHDHETKSLLEAKDILFKQLQDCGFTSLSMLSLANIFEKDRGWSNYEPAFDILKQAVDNDAIWNKLKEMFWNELNIKTNA